jgi:hypothetical protein
MPDRLIKIKPITALVCDDVRHENNGKPILIGLYTGDMTITAPMPTQEEIETCCNINVYLWIPFEVEETGEAKIEIKLTGPNQKEMGLKMGIHVRELSSKNNPSPLTVGPFPLKLWQNGNLKIEMKNSSDKEWETIRIIPVKFNAVPTEDLNLPPIQESSAS